MMLHPPGIGVPDWPPPFEYALADLPSMARTFEPFIAAGFSDAEAWEALFTDEHRLEIVRAVYGNRKGRRRAEGVSGQGRLW